MQDVYPPFLAR